ncbi:MAG TPA: YeeE/YedE thiosulfate transporter family protein [Methylomirabilota bacterium]|nr:YeeE/YedE thiosulfate transporter family protein [Methylomirabilota bacterium]
MDRGLAAQYAAVFGRPWPVWPAALLVATINVFLFAFDRPWTASDGLRNWGDWALTGAGLLRRPDLAAPWLYSGSLLNLGVLLGGCAAALLSREFAVRVPPRGELVKGAAGGVLMGTGAVLAFGCNVGGFFSAVSALSLAGFGMMLGLGLGAFLGLRYLAWELAHRPGWSTGPSRAWGRADGRQPLAGALLAAGLLAAAVAYGQAGYAGQGVFLLFGAAFGVVFQRSRFCLVRAFREPFMTGDAEHTRAAALAVAVSMLGFAIFKFTDLKDRGDWVFAAAGVGAVLGGTLFGVGMTLAGGCGAGSIWRAGEGQVKLWATLAGFALSVSLVRLALAEAGALSRLGAAVFLPSVVGWGAAVVLTLAVLAAWALAATWNEQSRAFSMD